MTAPHPSSVILCSAYLLSPAGVHSPSLLALVDRSALKYDGWGRCAPRPHSFRPWLHLQHHQWALSVPPVQAGSLSWPGLWSADRCRAHLVPFPLVFRVLTPSLSASGCDKKAWMFFLKGRLSGNGWSWSRLLISKYITWLISHISLTETWQNAL